MDVREIMYKLAEKNSLYGYGANLYKDDPDKSKAYLKEIYEQIMSVPENAERTFGIEVVEAIIDFCASE